MNTPGSIDPVLALLDFLDGYRRSLRCWLIGGPAAVDDLAVGSAAGTVGVRLQADYQYEIEERVHRSVLASQSRGDQWYKLPQPQPPPRGSFRNETQVFPLLGTLAFDWCRRCRGTGRQECPACRGTGGKFCVFCGGTGCPDCTERRGPNECRECEGRGWLRCSCGHAHSLAPIIHYEEAKYTYSHEAGHQDLLPSAAGQRAVARLFWGAWQAESEHILFSGSTDASILGMVRESHVLGDGLLEELARAAALAKRPMASAPKLRRGAGFGRLRGDRGGSVVRRHLLFQRLQARVAHAVSVSVRLGRLPGQFWGVGAGDSFRGALLGLERGSIQRLTSSAETGFWAYLTWWSLASGTPDSLAIGVLSLGMLGLKAARHFAERHKSSSLAHWSSFMQQCRRSRSVPAAPPTIVLLGPDPRASALLFSLFAHLAGFAQLADPAQGGTVVDDTYPELTAMLSPKAAAPTSSATYGMRFGEAMPAPHRARLIHMVYPPDQGPNALCRRILQRADQVWLVLPAGVSARAARGCVTETLGQIKDTPLTLILDDRAGVGFTTLPDALAEHRRRLWSVSLAGLRDRYLAGDLPAEEAAAIARWLVADAGLAAPPQPVADGEGPGAPTERRPERSQPWRQAQW